MGSKEPPKSAIRRGCCFAAVRCACVIVNAPPERVASTALRSHRTWTIFSRILDRRRPGIFLRCFFVIFGRGRLRVRRRQVAGTGNLVESVGDRTNQVPHAFAGGRGNSMGFKMLGAAEITQSLE